MTLTSLGFQHLTLRSAEDVHEMFRLLGYEVYAQEPFEGPDLDDLELDEVDATTVQRAYVVASRDNHAVYLYEVNDLRQTRLRGLAWNALQRGTALLVVTRDYREITFAHPRFVGSPTKSNVRVDKLKMVVSDPTRHDLDTLNAIHAHRRTGQQVYEAQAEAFNVTRITRRFYDEYKVHYDFARETIRYYNRGIPEFQNADQEDKLHAFTQRLLGRLMFLYFLQRKGWLGGHLRFLTDRFIDTIRRHAGEFGDRQETFYYYREVLEPLFFQTMNTRRPDDITQWPGVRIPYLNGGLFDQSRDPDGVIILPDALFDPHSSDGLLAFFNRYNFTIADDTPLEQDVAVDPEMLGKVFENMLEERDRGQTGSFYTPRTIVSYMCQEALAGYLVESANIPRDKTRAQFDPDQDDPLALDEARRVEAALETLTALDPAVGSGSFLIGMLNEIITLRRACARTLGVEVTPALLADWKEAIIRDTLYGVDIKPEAIEIAQLRLWLALVVDQTIEQARPLPNLDYKLMAGNSLIETIDGEPVLTASATALLNASVTGEWEHVEAQLKLFDPNPVQMRMLFSESERQTQQERIKLDKLRQQFFRATPEERRQLREEITGQERRIVFSSLKEKAETLQGQIDHLGNKAGQQGGKLGRADQQKLEAAAARLARITTLQEEMRQPDMALPFFLYRLHFSEVFAAKGGFDVVIANPPYVRGNILGEVRDEFKVSYPEIYSGDTDLYVYFFIRGFALLKSKGQLVYITSNKYLRSKYGARLRQFLCSKVSLRTIIDFDDLPVFDAAAYPCIVTASKFRLESNTVEVIAVNDADTLEALNKAVELKGARLHQAQLSPEGWQITDASTRNILEKLQDHSQILEEYVDGGMYRGPETGLNAAFIVDRKGYEQLVLDDSNSREVLHPILEGKDIKRWKIENPYQWIIYAPWDFEIESYPAIKAHLLKFEKPLRSRPEVHQGRYPWYALRRYASGYHQEFLRPKIVWGNLANRPEFALDRSQAYINAPASIIAIDEDKLLLLLGILNSNVTHYFMHFTGATRQQGYIEYKPIYIKQIPIPLVSDNLFMCISASAQRCLDTPDDAARAPLENELNMLVYQAYGLDEDDIRAIEEHLKG
jgi:adenine-specific DNA-methyltransferase